MNTSRLGIIEFILFYPVNLLNLACNCNQEEEQRLRKVALNISKDVKKFWMKIEKLASHNTLIFYKSFQFLNIKNLISPFYFVIPGALQASNGA